MQITEKNEIIKYIILNFSGGTDYGRKKHTEKNSSKIENNFPLLPLSHLSTLPLCVKSLPLSPAQEYFSSHYPLLHH